MSEPEREIGTLSVQVVAARGLRAGTDGGYLHHLLQTNTSNPFCRVRLGHNVQESETVWNTLNPTWRRQLLFFPVDVPEACIGPGDVCGSNYSTGGGSAARGGTAATAAAAKPGNVLKQVTPSRHHLNLQVQVLHRRDPAASSGASPPHDKLGDAAAPLLGEAQLDFTDLLAGRVDRIDVWVALEPGRDASNGGGGSSGVSGGGSGCGEIRLAVDFDAAGRAPRIGDTAALVRLGHPLDFFPLRADKEVFTVEDLCDHDGVIVSYTSPEGWRCQAEVHRFLAVPVEKPEPFTLQMAAKAAVDTVDAVAASPAAAVATEAFHRVVSDGFDGVVALAGEAERGARRIARRWLRGGLSLAAADVMGAAGFADVAARLLPGSSGGGVSGGDGAPAVAGPVGAVDAEGPHATPRLASAAALLDNGGVAMDGVFGPGGAGYLGDDDDGGYTNGGAGGGIAGTEETKDGDGGARRRRREQRQPVTCPITGMPIEDPVVAADGHSYERSAIERWLRDHDTSPMTGETLATKALFRNYSLLTR